MQRPPDNQLLVLCPTEWHAPDFNHELMQIMRLEYMDRAYFNVADDLSNLLDELVDGNTYQTLASSYDAEWTANEAFNLSAELFQQLNSEDTNWINRTLLGHIDFITSAPVLDAITLNMVTSARTKLITAMTQLYHIYQSVPVLIDAVADIHADKLIFVLEE